MVAKVVCMQIRRAFNIRLVVAEVCGLYLSFSDAPAVLPSLVVLALVVGALLVRDAYVHPAEGSPQETTLDAVVALTIVVLSQSVLRIPNLVRGLAVGLLMISSIRMVFLRPRGPRRSSRHSYEMTRAMTVLWMAAGIVVVWTTAQVTPRFFAYQGFCFTFIPIALFSLAFGTGKGDLPSVGSYGNDLIRKQESLWAGKTNGFEILSFALIALPLAVATFTAPTASDRLHAATNMAALVALSGLWIYMRKANRLASLALQKDIDARYRSKKP